MVSRVAVACGLRYLSACLGRCDRPATSQRRFSVESGWNTVPPEPSGRCHAHSRRTKSVIRACGHFPLRLVTGEFYAWVTAGNVTPRRAAPEGIRDKRPVGRWLRSSSHNCADQGSIVIESLSVFPATSGTANPRRTSGQSGQFCLANPVRPNQKFAGTSYSSVTIRAGRPRRGLGPSVYSAADRPARRARSTRAETTTRTSSGRPASERPPSHSATAAAADSAR